MKTLVIGGNRFFGKRLAEELVASGHEVTLLNRRSLDDGLGARVRRIQLDRRELRAGHPALGQNHWDVVYDQACYQADEARGACGAFAGRALRYVFTSSQSVYGEGAAISEDAFDPHRHRFEGVADRNVDYAEAKRQAETVFAREASFPVVAVRFPIVLGEDDYTKRLEFHVERIRNGSPIFHPDTQARISFIHAGDAAGFLVHLGTRPETGSVNAAAAEPIRIADLLGLIEARVGRTVNLATDKAKGEPSPFGISPDWFMSTARMLSWGYEARPIMDWLPGLIERLAPR